MQLSKHFKLEEMTKSMTATRKGIDEAIPALVDLRNQMAQLDLDDEFGVDVSDYIVEEQEIITPPLPPQPQPVVDIRPRTQQINSQTNLTRTQEALLSPMEKVIAGRKV